MKTNTEDGGISRAYSVNAGQRYIYSYIEKVGSSDTVPQLVLQAW